MHDNASSGSKPWLVAGYCFLALFGLLTFGFTIIGLGMDGMRHSTPDPSRFDPYYLECLAPSLLAALLVLTIFFRIRRPILTIMFGLSLLAAFAWFIFEAYRGNLGFGVLSAAAAVAAVFVWWGIVGSRSGYSTDAKSA